MSTIKVDTIQKNGGASEISIDKLGGVTAAGSMIVVGEGGSTTTNLQQWLAKVWHSSSSSASVSDSLNVSGGTDNGTGDYSYTFSNNFASSNIAISGLCLTDDRNAQYSRSRATTDYRIRHYGHDDAFADVSNAGQLHGDLA